VGGPERSREIASAARAWQKQKKKSRCPLKDLAKKLKVSLKSVENAVKNPAKRLRVANERLKLRAAIKMRAKKTKARQNPRDSAAKIVRDLGLRSVSEATARRERRATRIELKKAA